MMIKVFTLRVITWWLKHIRDVLEVLLNRSTT